MPVILKPGKETPLLHHHHWIFSGAVADISDDVENGAVTEVLDAQGNFLAQAYVNRQSALIGRVISFDQEPVAKTLAIQIERAWNLRRAVFDDQTTCYRIINSEGDEIPGLIVDRYAHVLVIQSTTLGIDQLLPIIQGCLLKIAQSVDANEWSVFVKSTSPSRRAEGLQDQTEWLAGNPQPVVDVLEDGIRYQVNVETSQKTGLFLDQREMRRLVASLAKDKSVLNCFSYTGGFSLAALKGGARNVVSVDLSQEAIRQLETNMELNHFSHNHESQVADVFDYLETQEKLPHQLMILDPPAFAKRKNDVPQAMRAYRHLNTLALKKMPAESWLVTSSCSYHVNPVLFQKIIFQAAQRAGRSLKIVQRHRLAFDHPINIFHPEGEYLKSIVAYVP